MDGHRIDQLAKRMAARPSRRSVLKGLGKTALAVIGIGGTAGVTIHSGAAAACRDIGQSCSGDEHCCSSTCGEPNSRGRRTCLCPAETTSCGRECCAGNDLCVDGACVSITCGNGGACTVFVTDTAVDGAFGGIAAADAICQSEAEQNGIPGTYFAWLSDGQGISPSSRFFRSDTPYVSVNGTVIANNWADLTDGNLSAPIEFTSSGAQAVSEFIWSNTTAPGDTLSSALDGGHCINWTYNTFSSVLGEVGFTSTVTNWTTAGVRPCSFAHRFFCFQQP